MEWTEYDKWNEKLADYFFSGDFAQQPVYLDMEHELVERLSLEIHGNIDDVKHHFSSVIAKTLILNSTANPFQSHLGRLKYWEAGYARGEFLTPPPCIALLSFFSLIAEEMISDENFSARNYYGRLNNRLCLDDENASRLMRGYQKVKIFWETLNKWLLNCDGEYGLPTARALDSRVHVSIPISQALVRDTDRKQLKKMFVEFNLSPHQLEAPSNMKQWLNYWLLNSSNHHTSLSRLWRNNDEIRDKITLIACEELLQWDGNRSESFSRSSNSDQPHSKLTILAEFVRNPIPRLTIFLVVYGESENYRGNYEISEGTDESARKALENCNQIRLEELSQNNILSLEPWDEIYSGDLLVGTLFLERSFNNHEIFLKRQPQLLIVLTFNEQQNCYTEVNQVHLMAKNIILCRNEIFEKVSNHLLECARKGYSIFDSCQLKGLPDGWRAFTDVQIILQKENSGLETLIPSSARQLKLTGGMRIRKKLAKKSRRF